MPSARSTAVTMVHAPQRRSVLGSAPTSLGNSASAQVAGVSGWRRQHPKCVYRFSKLHLLSPSRAVPRGLAARHVYWTSAGLLCITKEPSSAPPCPARPPAPTLARRGRRSRVLSWNWLQDPKLPGTRKGEGADAATIGRVRAKRAVRSAKTPRALSLGPTAP